jgi:hypothetical protein
MSHTSAWAGVKLLEVIATQGSRLKLVAVKRSPYIRLVQSVKIVLAASRMDYDTARSPAARATMSSQNWLNFVPFTLVTTLVDFPPSAIL